MFGGLSRLLLLALVVIAVLYAIRQFNKLRQEVRREVPRPRPATQRSSPRQQSQPAVQDLIACRACGAKAFRVSRNQCRADRSVRSMRRVRIKAALTPPRIRQLEID